MKAYALMDIGQMGSMSQDYIHSSSEMVNSLPNLFLVADGIGDHKAGDYASQLAVESLVIYINRAGKGPPVIQLKMGIEGVSERLYEGSLKQEGLKDMGCTSVAGAVKGGTLYVTSVGDSRLYLIQADAIRQVTRDHSCVEEMMTMGQMCRGSVGYNSRKNIITRAVGIGRSVEPDLFEVDLGEGDYILLCSDGLGNMVDDDTICSIVIGPEGLKEEASYLTREADRQGGTDNITVVLMNPLEREAGIC